MKLYDFLYEGIGNTEQEYPSYMVKTNLLALKKNVDYLLSRISAETAVDNWAEDAVSIAAHEISQLADYMRTKEPREIKK